MQNDSLTIRPYRPGDETAILDLFRRAFDRKMPASFWTWRFRNNPFDEPQIALAFDGDRLVSHYSLCPLPLAIAGEPARGALSATVMTDPAWRGRGLIPRLARFLFDRLEERGYSLVWGFPNRNSHRMFVEKLGRVDVMVLPLFRHQVAGGGGSGEANPSIDPLHEFDQEADRLWERIPSRNHIVTPRGRTFLNWRFFEHPTHEYTVLGYRSGDELNGYLAFKRYGDSFDLVDLQAERPVVAVELVRDLIRRAGAANVAAINTWIGLRSELHGELEALMFHYTAPVTYFGCHPLRELSGVDPTHPASWRISMADSDVY